MRGDNGSAFTFCIIEDEPELHKRPVGNRDEKILQIKKWTT